MVKTHAVSSGSSREFVPPQLDGRSISHWGLHTQPTPAWLHIPYCAYPISKLILMARS